MALVHMNTQYHYKASTISRKLKSPSQIGGGDPEIFTVDGC